MPVDVSWPVRSGRVRCGSDGPGQTGWCGPDQRARRGLPQTPRRRALHPVVVAASAGNIAGTGETALVVGDCVIEVAARHWPAADREPAVLVTNLNEVPHPVRHPVSGSRVGVGARGTPIVVHGLTVVGGRIRTADLADSRRASLQHGPQSGNQPCRRDRSPGRIQPTQRGGGWLIQEGDRHSDGDPPEHTGTRRTVPGCGRSGARVRARVRAHRVRVGQVSARRAGARHVRARQFRAGE